MKNVLDDMIFRTSYGSHHAGKAMERLKAALGQVVDGAIRLEADV